MNKLVLFYLTYVSRSLMTCYRTEELFMGSRITTWKGPTALYFIGHTAQLPKSMAPSSSSPTLKTVKDIRY